MPRFKSAAEARCKGQLIALEGTRGPELTAAARKLQSHLKSRKIAGGVSEWDASNIFFEMGHLDSKVSDLSPRTLLLLYAADLAFRLRWEIRPALEEGRCVIAAPYVQSAAAFGKAAGLPRRWMAELFRFAPKPQISYRVRESEKFAPSAEKASAGFLEFCFRVLGASSSSWDSKRLRERSIQYLEALERRRGCQTITERLLAAENFSR
ncbi:MAG TPA: hypothetical protein VGK99_21820 [Acidobacteriota bacterium]|jgi:hypothetical protein